MTRKYGLLTLPKITLTGAPAYSVTLMHTGHPTLTHSVRTVIPTADFTGQVGFASDVFRVDEGDTVASLLVRRIGGSRAKLDLRLTTFVTQAKFHGAKQSYPAVPCTSSILECTSKRRGADFMNTSTTFSLERGTTETYVPIRIFADTEKEPIESFGVVLELLSSEAATTVVSFLVFAQVQFSTAYCLPN